MLFKYFNFESSSFSYIFGSLTATLSLDLFFSIFIFSILRQVIFCFFYIHGFYHTFFSCLFFNYTSIWSSSLLLQFCSAFFVHWTISFFILRPVLCISFLGCSFTFLPYFCFRENSIFFFFFLKFLIKLPVLSYFSIFSYFTDLLSDFLDSSSFPPTFFSSQLSLSVLQFKRFVVLHPISFLLYLLFHVLVLSLLILSHVFHPQYHIFLLANFFRCRKNLKLNFLHRILHFAYSFYLFFLIFRYFSSDIVVIYDFVSCPIDLLSL